MHTVTFLQGIVEALTEEMERDENVFVMGEDVAWNILGDGKGLVEKFGLERVRNTPISEAGFVGSVGLEPDTTGQVTHYRAVVHARP